MPNRRLDPTSSEDLRDPSDRAQPGDVLGVETEGKRTNLGDDAEDEDEELAETEEEISELRDDDDD